MNLEKTEPKFHSYVNKLREEFRLNIKKAPDDYKHWFCLKKEKLADYLTTNNIYPSRITNSVEEENTLLKRFRQMEIETEILNTNKNLRQKEKNTEKDKNNDFNGINSIGFVDFELKAARKTGSTIEFEKIKNFNFNTNAKNEKNEKTKNDIHKKSEPPKVITINETPTKKEVNELKRKKHIVIEDSNPRRKKIKR